MKEVRNVIWIDGQEVEVHYPRTGTKCKCCGKPLAKDAPAHHTVIPTSPSAYVCQDCADIHDMSEDAPEEFRGLATKKGSLTAIIWRSTKKPSLEDRVYLAAAYKVRFYRKSKTYLAIPQTALSLHGSKDIFRGMERFQPTGCQTVSIGKIRWTTADIQFIRENQKEIFAPLFRIFGKIPEQFESFFGGAWCRPNFFKLNPAPVFSFPYENTNTFFHKISFVEDISNFLDDFLSGKFESGFTGSRILNKFKVYSEGYAQAQKEERNKGWTA